MGAEIVEWGLRAKREVLTLRFGAEVIADHSDIHLAEHILAITPGSSERSRRSGSAAAAPTAATSTSLAYVSSPAHSKAAAF